MLCYYLRIAQSIPEQRISLSVANCQLRKMHLSERLEKYLQNDLVEHEKCRYLFGRIDIADWNCPRFRAVSFYKLSLEVGDQLPGENVLHFSLVGYETVHFLVRKKRRFRMEKEWK